MTEKIETNLPQAHQERFESDKERLRFLERNISGRIREVRKSKYGKFLQTYRTYEEEKGIKPGGYITSKYFEEISKLRNEFEKTTNQATIEGLNNLRIELENNPALKNFIPEMNAFIEAARTMFLTKEIIKYKEYQVMTGAPGLSEEEIKKQDILREDMTEGRALIQWHVLQNETDPEYLRIFSVTLKQLLNAIGFKDEWRGMERGLRQELGILKILKKYFKKITPGEPKEDAHYAIDFWAETEDGETIIFQSKSSSPFGRQGIFDEEEMQKLEGELLEIGDTPEYQTGSGKYGLPLSGLIKIKKLQKDSAKATQYAESLGIENPKFYLIVSRADNFNEITGEPLSDKNKSLEKELEAIAK